jgi:hypothetical protein
MLPIETSNRKLIETSNGNFPTECYRKFPTEVYRNFQLKLPTKGFQREIKTSPPALDGSFNHEPRSQVQSTMVGAVQYRGSIDAARTILAAERMLSCAWPAVALLVVYSVNQV